MFSWMMKMHVKPLRLFLLLLFLFFLSFFLSFFFFHELELFACLCWLCALIYMNNYTSKLNLSCTEWSSSRKITVEVADWPAVCAASFLFVYRQRLTFQAPELLCEALYPGGPINPWTPGVPDGPWEPFIPLGPIGPRGPGEPGAPWVPFTPLGPIGPTFPLVPLKPLGPISPGGPLEPRGPIGPWGPAGPGGPVLNPCKQQRE